MPIYEFHCKGCGENFEKLSLPGKPDGLSCPSCGSQAVARQLSTFGVRACQGPLHPSRVLKGVPAVAPPAAADAVSLDSILQRPGLRSGFLRVSLA